MSAKAKVQSRIRSTSPLMPGVPHRTEARRNRSRSRGRVDSQLIRRVEQIPAIHNAVEYLISTYCIIKDSNPFLKENLQRTEDLAFWLKQKTEDFVTLTSLDGPLKRLDSAAANGFESMEKARLRLKLQYEMSTSEWADRFRDVGFEVKRLSQNVNYVALETLQTMLDYIEETFEAIMIPPSKESAKYSQNVELGATIGRIFDMTYRLQVGIISFAFEKMRQIADFKTWQSILTKYFDPAHIRTRASIISQEIYAPPGKKLNYMENKELTEIDRQLIATARIAVAAKQKLIEFLRAGPANLMDIARSYFEYIRDLLKQLGEATSFRDIRGIGFHETRRTLDFLASQFQTLKQSQTFLNLLDWLAYQEKSLIRP